MAEARIVEAIAGARACGKKHGWAEIGQAVGLSWQAARGLWRRRPTGTDASRCPICDSPFRQEKVSFEERGNTAEAASESARIRTLEQLLDAARVDLGTWQVRDWGVKKWEVGANVREGELTWNAGVMDGHLDYLGLGIEDLWSVWAKFVRKAPIPLFPVLRPVECTVGYARPEPPAEEGIWQTVVFADPQFGFSREYPESRLESFHDRTVLDVILQIVAWIQPRRICILGDYLDNVMWTDKFLRSPKFEYACQPAIVEAHWWLRQFREACPEARMTLHEGNHDARMKKQIMTHLRAAYGLREADEFDLPPMLSPQRLLALDKLGVEWIGDYPNDEDWLTPDLRLVHGDVAKNVPGATARALVEAVDVSTIFGHIHRKERVSRTIHLRGTQRTVVAYCPGCACRIDGAVPGVRARQNWQQGLAIVDTDGEMFNIQDVEVCNGRAIWNGRLFEARDRVEDLRRDVGRWLW